jgi:hypothetical protein
MDRLMPAKPIRRDGQFIAGYGGCGRRELALIALNIAQDDPIQRVATKTFKYPAS